jgi:hypothetical protein
MSEEVTCKNYLATAIDGHLYFLRAEAVAGALAPCGRDWGEANSRCLITTDTEEAATFSQKVAHSLAPALSDGEDVLKWFVISTDADGYLSLKEP